MGGRQTSSCDDNGNVVVVRDASGAASWHQQSGDMYVVTPKDRNGRSMGTIRTTNWHHANGINMMHGNVWLERGGKRYLLKKVG